MPDSARTRSSRSSVMPRTIFHREVGVVPATPARCPTAASGAYYPEMNSLVPLWYHDQKSTAPADKGVPVKIRA